MGADIPEPETTEPPIELMYLIDMHTQLRFSSVKIKETHKQIPRDSLNYSEIDSYCRVSGLNLHDFEIDAILSIDSIFDRAANGELNG